MQAILRFTLVVFLVSLGTACSTIALKSSERVIAVNLGIVESSIAQDQSNLVEKKKVEISSEDTSLLNTSEDCEDVTILEQPKRLREIKPNEHDLNQLKAGEKTTSFKLPNLEGTEVNLYDVLDENEYVLIDFWASWCSPCIAEFSTLKKIYSTYNDDGFDIVSVSLDRQSYEWKRMSEKQELPWIDLADTEGMDGSTATSYSVEGIPRKYLVDQNGCILHSDIDVLELERFLKKEYGNDEPSQTSEIE